MRRPWIFWLLAVVLAVSAGVWWLAPALQRMIVPRTFIVNSSPVTRYVTTNVPTRHVATGLYSIDLPYAWVSAPLAATMPAPTASWRGGADGPDTARRLDIYIDHIPDIVVNRILPVAVRQDRLLIAGSVSENCSKFASPTSETAASGRAPATWEGVTFTCDEGNYERDVVAIASSSASISLAGLSHGQHAVLLVYTDNSAAPDFSRFDDMVTSFRLP